jgi:2-phospho-L-lactate/phosphoenolpyruvate guanylyltransferase
MIPWLLIPVKSLDAGKGRLDGAMQPAYRRRLNEFFLHRILRTADHFPGCDRTAVISGCGDVLRIAEAYGAKPIRQRFEGGLNSAVAQGVAALRRISAENILLIACDEPLVRPVDLRDVVRRGAKLGGIVICPDKHGKGTNALYLPSCASIRFQFGEDSLFKHVREALRNGLAPHVCFNARIALDIDTLADLVLWRRSGLRQRSMTWLRELGPQRSSSRE